MTGDQGSGVRLPDSLTIEVSLASTAVHAAYAMLRGRTTCLDYPQRAAVMLHVEAAAPPCKPNPVSDLEVRAFKTRTECVVHRNVQLSFSLLSLPLCFALSVPPSILLSSPSSPSAPCIHPRPSQCRDCIAAHASAQLTAGRPCVLCDIIM